VHRFAKHGALNVAISNSDDRPVGITHNNCTVIVAHEFSVYIANNEPNVEPDHVTDNDCAFGVTDVGAVGITDNGANECSVWVAHDADPDEYAHSITNYGVAHARTVDIANGIAHTEPVTFTYSEPNGFPHDVSDAVTHVGPNGIAELGPDDGAHGIAHVVANDESVDVADGITHGVADDKSVGGAVDVANAGSYGVTEHESYAGAFSVAVDVTFTKPVDIAHAEPLAEPLALTNGVAYHLQLAG
jgi:hypothetical protein